MSFEEDRNKRNKRIQSKQNAIKKQTKIAKTNGLDVTQPHKFAKHHAMDCGNPKCMLCGNPRKLYKEPTIQEESFKVFSANGVKLTGIDDFSITD